MPPRRARVKAISRPGTDLAGRMRPARTFRIAAVPLETDYSPTHEAGDGQPIQAMGPSRGALPDRGRRILVQKSRGRAIDLQSYLAS
jgi:hypothetical protein